MSWTPDFLRCAICKMHHWPNNRKGLVANCTDVIVLDPYPEPGWSSVHRNATGWPSVHWDTTGRPSEYLQGTLEHHWKNSVETVPHWNATGETLTIFAYIGTRLEKLSWNCPTLGCHWGNANFCSLHWNTTGGTVIAHTHPGASRVASMPVWNDKMAGHQPASGQVSVNSAFTWSLLLFSGYQFCS